MDGERRSMTAGATRALLSGLVDYAGLFPPAGLGMAAAAAEYARYREEETAWMLGRFVLPAARLDELEAAAPWKKAAAPWPLSALVGPSPAAHAREVTAFSERQRGRATVGAVELAASSRPQLEAALAATPPDLEVFVEVPLDTDLPGLLAVVKARGARAKVRTGGVTPEAIPGPASLARFLAACAAANVPFKATAGLHHALRGTYPLTYEPGAPRATMHGFLNVFAAAAFARSGMQAPELEELLQETDGEHLRLEEEALSWRDRRIDATGLAAARCGFALSFGSCSFREPVAELRSLGVLR
jgi:hypothetical protein